jgi:hypothetical protein
MWSGWSERKMLRECGVRVQGQCRGGLEGGRNSGCLDAIMAGFQGGNR